VGARATGTRGTPGAALSREVGAGAVGTRGAPEAALHREADGGAQATHGGPGAGLSREAGAGATGTHGTPGAALSREVGTGAVRTRGGLGAALRWEAGAGAQVTRGSPGAAISQEAGTTPPPPLPRPSVGGQGVASSRSSRRSLYLAHDFNDHDHLDLGYLGIKGLSSACGTHRFLLRSQHMRPHDAATAGGCQFVGFYLRLILQSHRLWCSCCDGGRMLEYIW
jgi:hypothetical protein